MLTLPDVFARKSEPTLPKLAFPVFFANGDDVLVSIEAIGLTLSIFFRFIRHMAIL